MKACQLIFGEKGRSRANSHKTLNLQFTKRHVFEGMPITTDFPLYYYPDQRVSGCVVSIVLGFSILLSPVLAFVPFAVVFGIFLYMGVSSINGIQVEWSDVRWSPDSIQNLRNLVTKFAKSGHSLSLVDLVQDENPFEMAQVSQRRPHECRKYHMFNF